MFKNYLKIAQRNLVKNKVYSAINILGLTIGLAACLLVATVVIDDLSYDRQWKRSRDIYRIVSVDHSNINAAQRSRSSFTGLGPNLKKDFPEVEDYCRISLYKNRMKMGPDKDGVEIPALAAEPSVWKLFNFNIIQGNPKKFVKGYVNLVITKKIKNQYFPDSNPIGKVVTDIPSYGKPGNYLITGIIKEFPANTNLRSEVIAVAERKPEDNKLYDGSGMYTQNQYLLFKSGTSVKQFQTKMNNWYKKQTHTEFGRRVTFELQPITDVYLHSEFDEYSEVRGNIRDVYIFSGVAFLLLLIGCINFINLTTARAIKRVREVGIRKVLGAGKKELTAQFLFESLLFFAIAFVLSMALYQFFMKPLEAYLGHALTLNLAGNIALLGITSLIVLLVSLFTGLYPAWLISRPKAVIVLKGKLSSKTESGLLRKTLVVLQFTIAIVILTATLIVQLQLRFIDHKDLGFDKNNLLNIDYISFGTKGATFKQEILKITGVESASITNWAPSLGAGYMSKIVDDPTRNSTKINVNYIAGDLDLVKTLKLQLLDGRDLSAAFANDAFNLDSLMEHDTRKLFQAEHQQSYLTTAYTARLFGIKNFRDSARNLSGIPVGIVKDFNNESLHAPLKPCIIQASTNTVFGNVLVRVKPNTQKQVLASIRKLWQQFFPEKVLKTDWISDLLDAQYRAEQKLEQLFTFFTLLIVFLACLGLFGLATFTAEQRVKEIGIRKVLGASASQVTALLSKDFMVLVLFALLIASPVAWWGMQKWLQEFAYRIPIQWWMFALSGAITVILAIATVSFQAIKAALANPVKSLRSE